MYHRAMFQDLAVAQTVSRRIRWLLALPKLGIVLLLGALIALLWLLQHNEAEEERAALIKDVLWLEQDLQFHLNANEEQKQQLAIEMSSLPEPRKKFRLRADHMLKNVTSISQLLWLDNERKVIDALPGNGKPTDEIEGFGPSVSSRAFDMASRLGTPHYSEPYFIEGNRAHIELMVPLHNAKQAVSGMLVLVYPLAHLLASQVPWWFTEKYKVEIVDDNNIRYATKTHIDGNGAQRYEIPFDPPGFGL